MLLTCQPVPVETVVMVYSGELVIVARRRDELLRDGDANVIDAGSAPNELIDVDRRGAGGDLLVRGPGPAMPAVSKSFSSVAASCAVVSPASLAP